MTAPAEELRAAAKKIRNIATKATPGPWVSLEHGDRIVRDPAVTWAEADDDPCGEGAPLEYVIDEPLEYNRDNGDHIALWHPGVAELVAAWLDDEADMLRTASGRRMSTEQITAAEHWHRHGLAVARAINGGDALAVAVVRAVRR